MHECRLLGGCKTGDAKLTKGYNLPARFILHTVGPVWQGGTKGEAEKLASCYRRSVEIALAHGLKTLAFPCLSTGIYGYPADQAAQIAVETVRACADSLETVIFCCFSARDFALYESLLAELL